MTRFAASTSLLTKKFWHACIQSHNMLGVTFPTVRVGCCLGLRCCIVAVSLEDIFNLTICTIFRMSLLESNSEELFFLGGS